MDIRTKGDYLITSLTDSCL